ncbi:polyprenyl synthetase family protein [Candidatus Woesebacteria bacterium]|nr:polyprenyl synthetase family protein [Candidatus Woesebacteria bacterium]
MKEVLRQYLSQYVRRIDQGIAEELEKRLSEVKTISPQLVPILEAMKELSVGGKRLRAMLVILGYQLSGHEVNNEVIRVAVAVELFHLGLLIQDDFMDRDELRRGVKTIIARYEDKHVGNFISMLAGDYTFGWVAEILSSLNLPSKEVNRAIRVWGKYMTRVGYGQTLDGLAIADEATILQILSIKSGEYSCVMPLLIGATLGGAEQGQLDQLEKYGMAVGHVFQLRDDWLGMYGDQEKTGKPVGHDQREGKHTYATMHGKERTEAEIAKKLKAGLELAGENQVMCELLNWVASRDN